MSCPTPLTYDALAAVPQQDALASRSEEILSWLAPYGRSMTGHAWLNLSAVDRQLTAACGAMIEMAAATLAESRDMHRITFARCRGFSVDLASHDEGAKNRQKQRDQPKSTNNDDR